MRKIERLCLHNREWAQHLGDPQCRLLLHAWTQAHRPLDARADCQGGCEKRGQTAAGEEVTRILQRQTHRPQKNSLVSTQSTPMLQQKKSETLPAFQPPKFQANGRGCEHFWARSFFHLHGKSKPEHLGHGEHPQTQTRNLAHSHGYITTLRNSKKTTPSPEESATD